MATLDQLRRAADLSILEVSRQTGIEYNRLWRYLRAEHHVTEKELAKVEGYLAGAVRERESARR